MKNHKIFAEKGRSMVEMLGVLAIIGVLSVGAIAGYQKAMMKYKMNKQLEQANDLAAGMLDFITRAGLYIKSADISSSFVKLGYIPGSMKAGTSANTYLDNFGNTVSVGVYTNGNFPDVYDKLYIEWQFTTPEQFVNLAQGFQRFSDSLYRINIFCSSPYGWYGDQACKTRGNCLASATTTALYTHVKQQFPTGGKLRIYFDRL
jgi:type II secretory pathway pseudopilin PulG